MSADFAVDVDPEIRAIVRPVTWRAEPVRVLDCDPRMDAPLDAVAARMRTAPEPADIIAAVRTMYKRLGIDPTKTRPSSEALLRRIRKGDPLPRINSLVDIINWTSLESQLSFGLYDAAHIHGRVTLRRGREGEAYAGIRKDTVHVGGRLVLADETGPFGNPTSDSARTMVTPATTSAIVVIYSPSGAADAVADRARVLTEQRIDEFCRTVGGEPDRTER
jgi:DNA/RNA-binding domain of Phe-tRNA-synthetase-like protein